MTGEELRGFEPVIGLEIHVQLKTKTKLFCGDVASFGAPPNTHVCPVCLGLPGALPVLNAAAVDLAMRAALALGCTVHETSVFARKNYFYPDLPKGYQITQYERPLATGGHLSIPGSDPGPAAEPGRAPGSRGGVRIRRVHLEEDAGKSLHDRVPGRTAIDLNRAGVPLIEIVTAPDLRSPEETRTFLTRLKRVLEYVDVSDCDMETGSLRVDANVSVRETGDDPLGTKTEVKNLNSFGNVERALHFEVERQARLLEAGGVVVQETRLWDAHASETRPMRSKERAHDYRYFPDPDLPPLVTDAGRIAELRAGLPELPHRRAARFVTEYRLPDYDAGVLTAARPLADFFEALADAAGDPKAASNWVMGDVLAWLNQTGVGIEAFPIAPGRLAGLVRLAADGGVSSTAAKEVFDRMLTDSRPAAEIVAAADLAQVSDADELAKWVDEALAANPDEAGRLLAGEARLVGFFVGQVLRVSGGKADPERVASTLKGRAEG